MQQRTIIGTKLLETLSRGLFVVMCTYGLPVMDAGQFGLAATVIGIIAFVLGYERQIDIQRQVAGRSVAAIRYRMVETLRFFVAHYFWMLPSIILILWQVVGWPEQQVMLIVLIAVAEHISNQSYQAVLIEPGTLLLLLLVAIKNILLILATLGFFLMDPQGFRIGLIIKIWAVISVLYLLLKGFVWIVWIHKPTDAPHDATPRQGIAAQYRASRLHFVMGLIAMTTLQADRLVVGGMLTPHDIGLYFRNMTLLSLALQIFNIVFFNRIAPRVYAYSRDGWMIAKSVPLIRMEYRRFAIATILAVSLLIIGNQLMGHFLQRFGIEILFMIVVSLALLLRAAGDYSGLLLLSGGKDRFLFINQVIAVVFGVAVLILASRAFQLDGAIIGSLSTPLAYLILNLLCVLRIPERIKHHFISWSG